MNFHRTTWHHIPEDVILHNHGCQSLKSISNDSALQLCRQRSSQSIVSLRPDFTAAWLLLHEETTAHNRAHRNHNTNTANTSTVALRVVGGDEKGTLCLEVQPGPPLPGGYKYGDLALKIWGVSNIRQ
jgi:hypothetical protein